MVERLLTFIYATRSRDWKLHLLAGEMLTKVFCSIDRTKYRRLLSVYIQNMKALEYSDPEVFMNGEFCVKKTDIPFTSLGMDHGGEQVIKTLKGEGGGIKGITNNENVRLRFFLSSPVLAKISDDIKKMINKDGGGGVILRNIILIFQLKYEGEVKRNQSSMKFFLKDWSL